MRCFKRNICLVFIMFIALLGLSECDNQKTEENKTRIIISTDIGGTDPDDFQSAIHLLMYSDIFTIEGLISSPFGDGRKEDMIDMINLYEEDLDDLKKHSEAFPDPDYLRSICKQGAKNAAPYKGFTSATEGSEWIIKCARKNKDAPLWILVWGGIEDLAQALHDAPDIEKNVRVYWIGGPNKKWSVNAYAYIAEHHPDLWMIESNATYRGWFLDSESPENITNEAFYENYINGHGSMGKAFKNYYHGHIKMGDTPSLAYLLDGNPDDPEGESWGGSYTGIAHSSRSLFNRNTTDEDTIIAYGIIEWQFMGPEKKISDDIVCFTMEISNQVWPGYYLGDGVYGIRYSSKKPETCSYSTVSEIPELDGLTGKFVSIKPWPGTPGSDDYPLGNQWYSDRPDSSLFYGIQQGARTVSIHRKEFLGDWQERWSWIQE